MQTRLLLGLALGALWLVWPTSAAFAGGFAVTTLDPLPSEFRAGETYHVGFMMRQHGVTPVVGGTPSIVLTRGSQVIRFAAHAAGATGHYVADVTFPTDGEWSWSVDQRPFPTVQSLGTVQVSPPLPPLRSQPPAEFALLGLVAFGLLALLQVKRLTSPAARSSKEVFGVR